MLVKVVAFAFFAALSFAGIALAQTDVPAELPANDYPGQSYIDSKGCIFLRAGYGDAASWVPQVGQDRKQVCGQAPTNAVARNVAPSARQTRVKKIETVVAAPAPVMIGCPVSVPVARRYATTDGGSVVICTAKNGSLTGARSPIYPAGSGVGAALSNARSAGVVIPLYDAQSAVAQTRGASSQSPIPATAAVASGSYYVQVGAFAQPSNADGASARLQALGLPVSKGRFTKKGRALQAVFAGPFSTSADAQGALATARSGGFSDAYIR